MAKVSRVPNGYEFSGLSGIGMRLVNEFQRCHPELCVPTTNPSYRFIHLGLLEQNVELGKLVAEVRRLDPEPAQPTFKGKR